MNEEIKQTADSEADSEKSSNDVSYGGCKYRVAYDKYEKNAVKGGNGVHVSSVIIGIVLFVVFFLLGFLIIRYYNRSVDSYSQASNSADNVPQYTFQSFSFTDN